MENTTENYLRRQTTAALDGILNFLLLEDRWKAEEAAIRCILQILQERECGTHDVTLRSTSSVK